MSGNDNVGKTVNLDDLGAMSLLNKSFPALNVAEVMKLVENDKLLPFQKHPLIPVTVKDEGKKTATNYFYLVAEGLPGEEIVNIMQSFNKVGVKENEMHISSSIDNEKPRRVIAVKAKEIQPGTYLNILGRTDDVIVDGVSVNVLPASAGAVRKARHEFFNKELSKHLSEVDERTASAENDGSLSWLRSPFAKDLTEPKAEESSNEDPYKTNVGFNLNTLDI